MTAPAVGAATLSVWVDPAGYAAGSPVRICFMLVHTHAPPLWLNRRFLLGSPPAPRFARELWLDLRAPDGRNLVPRDEPRPASAAATDYGLLAPREEARIDVDLAERYGLTQPGRYLLRAHYADGNERSWPAPAGAVTLREHLQTPKIELRIR